MVRLENSEFLSQLRDLYEISKESGHVDITFEQYNEAINCTPSKRTEPKPENNKCLIRAVYKNEKISTIVDSSNVAKFNGEISTVVRQSMNNLEKRKRTRKTSTAENKAN